MNENEKLNSNNCGAISTWLVVVITTIVVTVVCYSVFMLYKNKNSATPTSSNAQVATPVTSTATLPEPSTQTASQTTSTSNNISKTDKTYINEKYKFAFDMSKPVKNYTISEVLPNSQDKSNALAYVEFSLPTSDKNFQDANGGYMVEKIAIIPTTNYKETTDPWNYKKIGASGNNTIAIVNTGGRDNPDDLNTYLITDSKNDFLNFQSY